MRRSLRIPQVTAVALLLLVPGTALAGGLDGFLAELDIRAGADLGSFRTDLSVTFGVSNDKLHGLFEISSRPADVYMFLRIGEVAELPLTRVVDVYKQHRGQGWGVIAKSLGIQPGSDEFHALKAGRLPGKAGGGSAKTKGKGGKSRR